MANGRLTRRYLSGDELVEPRSPSLPSLSLHISSLSRSQVLAAYVAVLSRSFLLDEGAPPDAVGHPMLLPVLDLLQHGEPPSVSCSWETSASAEPLMATDER